MDNDVVLEALDIIELDRLIIRKDVHPMLLAKLVN